MKEKIDLLFERMLEHPEMVTEVASGSISFGEDVQILIRTKDNEHKYAEPKPITFDNFVKWQLFSWFGCGLFQDRGDFYFLVKIKNREYEVSEMSRVNYAKTIDKIETLIQQHERIQIEETINLFK